MTYEEALQTADTGIAIAASGVATELITERLRQESDEGFTAAHDDRHKDSELARAAAAYAYAASLPAAKLQAALGDRDSMLFVVLARLWPWHWKWFKPTNRRRDLVKAGALIIAEIEQIDRAGGAPMKGTDT